MFYLAQNENGYNLGRKRGLFKKEAPRNGVRLGGVATTVS